MKTVAIDGSVCPLLLCCKNGSCFVSLLCLIDPIGDCTCFVFDLIFAIFGLAIHLVVLIFQKQIIM